MSLPFSTGGTLSERTEVLICGLIFLLTSMTGCPSDQFITDYRSIVSSELSLSALSIAESKVGCPYFWGAKGPDCFDCSGLITWTYTQADSDIRFATRDGLSKEAAMQDINDFNILQVDRYHVRPGDIVFITLDSGKVSHGGLFVGWIGPDKFKFINASSYYGKVVIDSFQVSGVVRGQWFVGFGRLLQ